MSTVPRGKRRRRIRSVMQEWLRNPGLLLFPWLVLLMAVCADQALKSGLPITCYILTVLARGTLLVAAATMLLPFFS